MSVITDKIHEIAKEISAQSNIIPYIAILQARRDLKETPAQDLQSLMGKMVDFSSMSAAFFAIDGNPVDVAYNYLFNKALESNAKYAFSIEEDTVVPWYGARNLLKTSEEYPDAIIVGVYYVKFSGPMFSAKDEQGRWIPVDVTPNTGLRRNILSCGMGCALIPVSAIKKIKAQYPDIPLCCIVPDKCWGDNEVLAIGQDNWFYHLANKCGIEIICDTSVHCLHMELATGKYTAHPDIVVSDYVTAIPVTERLTLKDKARVDADYIRRIQKPNF